MTVIGIIRNAIYHNSGVLAWNLPPPGLHPKALEISEQ